jgi:L-asparagine oxygenase
MTAWAVWTATFIGRAKRRRKKYRRRARRASFTRFLEMDLFMTLYQTAGSARTVADASGAMWSIAEPADRCVVDPDLARELSDAARQLFAGSDADDIDNEDLLVRAEVAMRRASPELLARLVDYRVNGTRDGALVLSGLPLDDPLPPTPDGGAFTGPWRELGVATGVQLMVMSVIGDVISYADEKNGRLVQDVCPIRGAETRQENSGSCLLELHTEDGFHPNKPHFVSLLGLRADHENEAVTVASGIRAVLPMLAPEHLFTLREPLFRIRLASSFVGNSRRAAYTAPMPVLIGALDDPDLCVDYHATEPLTEQAAAAFGALRSLLLGALVGVAMRPGDLLIVDNRKAVHGRTGFTPRYDGADRWLRRCFAVSDIRASLTSRYPASRVHRPLVETGVAR